MGGDQGKRRIDLCVRDRPLCRRWCDSAKRKGALSPQGVWGTTAQTRARTRSAAARARSPPTRTRRSWGTASGRSRTPSGARSARYRTGRRWRESNMVRIKPEEVLLTRVGLLSFWLYSFWNQLFLWMHQLLCQMEQRNETLLLLSKPTPTNWRMQNFFGQLHIQLFFV